MPPFCGNLARDPLVWHKARHTVARGEWGWEGIRLCKGRRLCTVWALHVAEIKGRVRHREVFVDGGGLSHSGRTGRAVQLLATSEGRTHVL